MLGKQSLGRDHVIGHPALTDTRTGLANLLHFELVYSYLFTAGDRGLAFTVLLLSVAHDEGAPDDRWLRDVGQAIRRTTRAADLVAHVGEGRYVVLLLGTNLSGARVAADRIEVELEGHTRARVAMGLAGFDARMTDASELLEAADRALHAAEGAGGGVELA